MSRAKEPPKPPGQDPAPVRPSLWQRGIHVENVALLVVAAFVVGILVGRTGQVQRQQALGTADPHAGLDLSGVEDPHADLEKPTSDKDGRSGAMDPKLAEESLAAARAHVADKDDPEDLIRLGNQAFDQAEESGDLRIFFLAIAAYERALQLQPGNPNVQTDLGIAYRNVGQPDTAIEHFQAAQTSDPRHLQSQLNLAVVYLYDKGDAEKAAQAAQRFLSLNPPPEMAATGRQILTAAQQQISLPEMGTG